MDHCAAVLRQFPADGEPVGWLSDQAYHRRIKTHMGQVQKLFRENAAVLAAHSAELLASLDPAANTYSYLALLDAAVPTDAAQYEAVPPVVADRLAAFFAAFDARQARYGGAAFTHLFTAVGSGKILPAAVAVPLLAGALERLDPTGAMLTSNHLVLARLAYHTGQAAAPALRRVLGRDVVFFPTSGGGAHPESDDDDSGDGDGDGGGGGDEEVDESDGTPPLCSARLLPPAFLSKDTGLTLPLKSSQVLEFEYLAGLLHSAVRAWRPARAAFARALTHPTADAGVSKIMLAAHRHWLLLGLLLDGRSPACPPLTTTHLRRACAAANRPYLQLAALFPSLACAHALRDAVAASQPTFAADGTAGLVRAVLAAFPQWQIARLRDVYTTLSLPAVYALLQKTEPAAEAATTATTTAPATTTTTDASGTDTAAAAATGPFPPVPSPMPTSVADVHAMVQDMIASGMVQAVVRYQPEAEEASADNAYLEFLPDDEELAEAAFAARLAATQARVRALGPLEKATDEHISLHRQYVRQYVQREARRAKEDGGGGGPGDPGGPGGGGYARQGGAGLTGGVAAAVAAAREAAGLGLDDVFGGELDEDLDEDEDLMTDALGGLY